jgi:type II secretory pathway component PulF
MIFLLNFVGVAILGAALLWAARLVYADRRGGGEDLMRRSLLLAGWILLLGGVLGMVVGLTGPFSVLFLLAIYLIERAYSKYMDSERRALLWALGVAADKGIPLEQAARAFADERSLQLGSRVTRLAELLEAGAPLSQALPLSGNPLSADALLAARVGTLTGQLGPAVHMATEHRDRFETVLRSASLLLLYVFYTGIAGFAIITFMMLKIVPVFVKMFADFGLQLPRLTQWLVAVSRFVVADWPLLLPPLAMGLLAVLCELSYDLYWSRYELPGFGWLWLRRDAALILRALALAAEQQRDFAGTVAMLSREYPRPSVGRRLEKAAARIEGGCHWCDALCAVRLLRETDRAVLLAAERVGNLPWALREVAESTARRFALWLRMAASVLLPVVVVVLGAVVLFVFAGLFLPLVSLIQGLT